MLMSLLNFNLSMQQICYVSLPESKAIEAISNYSVLVDLIAYEYTENIKLNVNETILVVELDLANMFDLTKESDFDLVKNIDNLTQYLQKNQKSLLRFVDLTLSPIYKKYLIKYRILDVSAIKKVYRI